MLRVDYIVSPKTGRKIIVDGQAYEKLMKSIRYRDEATKAPRFKDLAPGQKAAMKRGRTYVPPLAKIERAKERPLSRTLKDLPSGRKAKATKLRSMMEKRSEGRGSRTRGWAAAAPQKGRERHALKKECGDKCFLLPDREGFPVCPALRERQGCKADCRGVLAAKVRARQWKYPEVAARAQKMGRELGCGWA